MGEVEFGGLEGGSALVDVPVSEVDIVDLNLEPSGQDQQQTQNKLHLSRIILTGQINLSRSR